MVSLREFKGKSTIIVGEVNSGKTAYAREILQSFLNADEEGVAVIDMAPEMLGGVGGKLSVEGLEAERYYTADIIPPRLTGKTPEDIWMFARRNARVIEAILDRYEKNPEDVLFVNDVSIYLQAGDFERLVTLVNSTPTVVLNGYYGTRLGGGDLGERERESMSRLMKWCDHVIRL